MKINADAYRPHKPFGQILWVSRLRENRTSGSDGERLETGRSPVSRQSFTRRTFFRFIKQNLKIKSFIGNSENAVLFQVYVALIAYLLLCYLKFLCRLSISLQKIAQLLQLNLFRRCTTQELLELPNTQYPFVKHNNQLTMCFAWTGRNEPM